MSRRTWVAGALFVVLVGTGLAGADKPPPVGFVVWVLLAGLAAGIVWWRSPGWTRRVHAVRDAAVFGVLAGIVFGFTGGEPSIELPAWAPFAVVAAFGVLGAVGGWLLAIVLVEGEHSTGGQP